MSLSRTPSQGRKTKVDDNLLVPHDSDTASDRLPSDSDTAVTHITSRKFKRKLGDLHMTEIRELFDEFSNAQNAKLDALNSSMLQLKEETAEMKNSLIFMSKKYDEVLENLTKIQKDNTNYKVRIELLEQRVDFLERKSRSSTIELRNVPQAPTETKEHILQMITKVGAVVQYPVQISDVRDAYRMKTKNKGSSPIIVEFTSITTKENIIHKVKLFNKGNKNNMFNSSHLMIGGPTQPVYISESLTPFAKKLFYLARQHAKKHSFMGCWHSFGKIYMKKSDDQPTLRIDSEDDIQKLDQA